jgi:hypothetical protein
MSGYHNPLSFKCNKRRFHHLREGYVLRNFKNGTKIVSVNSFLCITHKSWFPLVVRRIRILIGGSSGYTNRFLTRVNSFIYHALLLESAINKRSDIRQVKISSKNNGS